MRNYYAIIHTSSEASAFTQPPKRAKESKMSNFTTIFTPNEVRAAGMGLGSVACAALDCMATALSWNDNQTILEMAADFVKRRDTLTEVDMRAAMAAAVESLNDALDGF